MRTGNSIWLGLCAAVLMLKSAAAELPSPLLNVLQEELKYSMEHLALADGTKPYFIAYTITDNSSSSIRATLGALHRNDQDRQRALDVDLRVGDYNLDSTHQIRGRGDDRRFGRSFGASSSMPLENGPAAVKHVLWLTTDRAFKAAVDRFQRVKTDLKTSVDEEDKAADFSRERPSVHEEQEAKLALDRAAWAERVRSVSKLARKYPMILDSTVALVGAANNRFMVSSEGTRLQTGSKRFRVILSASSKAEDGMDLSQSFIFNASTESGLPTDAQMTEAFQKVIETVLALRTAPIVEPYTGPAILRNRASAVFFHEIFGHRIEGHRQKDVEEGQTFTKMVGKQVLPEFLSVVDDPTRARFDSEDLRGAYQFDDEGVPGRPAKLVEKGILKTFLMSRSPVAGFDTSNGHGRREPGRLLVSRQANLIVNSDKSVPFDQLRQQLIATCQKENKPYGYLFEDITGGFTTTSRGGPQAFKVLPVVVYRVYADGKPDELVRGVDIVGTPLSCFSKILATGDDPAVFNGTCGAESGWVPVSAISPSILVGEIEIEKRERAQERLPILPSPITLGQATNDVVFKALNDELERSLSLQLEELEKPYFIQYEVRDLDTYRISADRGAIVLSDHNRGRVLHSQVRLGSYAVDNSNFAGARGRSGLGDTSELPIDDDYLALRQAIWQATDSQYKEAVATLTQKRAYMKDRNVEERPPDFTKAAAITNLGNRATLSFDRDKWEGYVRQISARFVHFPQIQDADVNFAAGGETRYLLNSERALLRDGTTETILRITAEAQSEDGERFSDFLSFYAPTPEELPPLQDVLAEVDKLSDRLCKTALAPVLDDYSGPVLFDGLAGPQLFRQLLARGITGQPDPVGSQRRAGQGSDDLENKIGKRILPASFQMYDDPRERKFGNTFLAGHYLYDDEAVPAERVNIVTGGKLEGMVMSRTPTKLFPQTNGHGRRGGNESARASIGCLYIDGGKGDSAESLKKKLLEAADAEGLKFGLRITGIQSRSGGPAFGRGRRAGRGSGGVVGDPVAIYKVFVSDGHEEPVRGCEFTSIDLQSLRKITAASAERTVQNSVIGVTPSSSIIAPAVLMTEVELSRIKAESEKKPVLKAPHER